MERITGIGGFFFRVQDPAALPAWYEAHFGIMPVPENYRDGCWWQDEGPTVFAPFPADTEYFKRPEQMWMINFHVRDLDGMVAQLRKAGISVGVDANEYPNGRFAHTQDPEGNPIELWQPGESDAHRPSGR
jgi:predicted enzyme related to lactoylglutathione lyase